MLVFELSRRAIGRSRWCTTGATSHFNGIDGIAGASCRYFRMIKQARTIYKKRDWHTFRGAGGFVSFLRPLSVNIIDWVREVRLDTLGARASDSLALSIGGSGALRGDSPKPGIPAILTSPALGPNSS